MSAIEKLSRDDVSGTSLAHRSIHEKLDEVVDKVNEHDTGKWTEGTEITLKVYEQDDEPELTEDHKAAIWIDSNDSDRVRFLFRRGAGDIVRTELS